MKRSMAWILGAVSLLVGSSLRAEDKTFKTNDEGFILNWLVLAPIKLDAEKGSAALDVELIKGQAKIMPKKGDKEKVGGETLTWDAAEASDEGVLDFNQVTGGTEDAAAYAVCYVQADSDWKGKVKTGSDDECLLWINGKEIIRNEQPRGGAMDQDEENVTLVKGSNTIVFKVINDSGGWDGRLRFVDKSDSPFTKVKISLTPPAGK